MAHDAIVQDANRFLYSLKVPKDRIAVFIGNKGETKRKLQSELGVTISVDSQESEVTISSEDSVKLYVAKDVIKAIARGFNPDVAELLLKPEYVLEMIDISDFATTKSAQLRLKGRVIGVAGKSRKTIEALTDTWLSVYGKTVCIIGEMERVSVAKRAVDSLLGGSQHAAVYKWLERQRRNLKAEF